MARIGDLLIASALILLALPLMVIVAIAIKLDGPGPVLSMRAHPLLGAAAILPMRRL